jgi:hypothetical protein
MRNRVWLRWLGILACIALVTVSFVYWEYTSVTDHYIASAFDSELTRNPTLAGSPALEKAFEAQQAMPELQLARAAVPLRDEKMLRRELLEVLIAQRLRERLSPGQILALYAQTVYLGDANGKQIFGVNDAARAYLGKSPQSLNTAEGAWLAALAVGPRYLLLHADKAAERRNKLLDRMAGAKLITAGEADRAKAEPTPSVSHL